MAMMPFVTVQSAVACGHRPERSLQLWLGVTCAQARGRNRLFVYPAVQGRDWSHNLNSPHHADAAWDALQRGDGRALFAYGASNDQALRKDLSPHTRDVARLRNRVGSDDGARVTLGMAVRGPEFSTIEMCVAD